MRRIQYYRLFAILIPLFLSFSPINADEIQIIKVHLHIDNDNEAFQSQIQMFTNEAFELLETQSFQIEIVNDREIANIVLSGLTPPHSAELYSRFDDNLFIIEIITPSSLAVSPILFTQFDIPLRFSIPEDLSEDDDYYQGLIYMIIGLTTYSINDCENTLFYLEDVSELVSTSTFNLANIEFYYGNCLLISGEFESALEAFRRGASPAPGEGAVISSKHATVNYLWTSLQLNPEIIDQDYFDYLTGYMLNCGFQLTCNGIQNESDQIDLLSRRAQIHALSFDYDSGIRDIDIAITLAEENELSNETLAELYTIRGEIIFLIYEWDRVEDNFDTAIELNPEYDRAYFQRGVLFYTMARREDALADFQTYLELNADSVYADEAQSYIESIEIELEALGG